MMEKLYQSPLRVYLVMLLLAGLGVFSAFKLPVSLFPNANKAKLEIDVDYGSLSAQQFIDEYGNKLENMLNSVQVDQKTVEKVEAFYSDRSCTFKLEFPWGVSTNLAQKEVQSQVNALAAAWPREVRDSLDVGYNNGDGGFLALSFFSDKRTPDELFDTLEPLLMPSLTTIGEARQMNLFNPDKKQIELELRPERMAYYGLRITDIQSWLDGIRRGFNGGSIKTSSDNLPVFVPRAFNSIKELSNLQITTSKEEKVPLRDLARVSLAPSDSNQQIFKTSGMASLILFATPKPGANIKKMSDDVAATIRRLQPTLPSDVNYKILINPSDSITSSIEHVFFEVAIAASLAVLVLFLFIGSLKNVATAAVEIPISLVLAFILMKITNMNINLISLAGLALSAGMNVDASVVVMENIFHHFNLHKGALNSLQDRLRLLMLAVNEVKGPIISSTIASLVVFVPLMSTDGLTNAILGDLARAVVFSHAFSAIVALILVPTVRLQLMRTETQFHTVSPIEKHLSRMESWYSKLLAALLHSKQKRITLFAGLAAAFIFLIALVLPRLPKEIIGIPETDWMVLNVTAQTSTDIKELDGIFSEIDNKLTKEYGEFVDYTFATLWNPKRGNLLIRLKNRKKMDVVWARLESDFQNTPLITYRISPWNPSELPIPDPPHLRVQFSGGEAFKRNQIGDDLRQFLLDKNIFPRLWIDPESSPSPSVEVRPKFSVLEQTSFITPVELAMLSRAATLGLPQGQMSLGTKTYPLMVKFNPRSMSSINDLRALPVGLEKKIVPLAALADIEIKPRNPAIYKIGQSELGVIQAKLNKSDLPKLTEKQKEAQKVVEEWREARRDDLSKAQVSLDIVDPNPDLTEGLRQLKWSLFLSVLLILFVMVLQFGDFIHALLVIVAVPLGAIGVILSLWIFQSNISLNSALGTILLGGLAVANSILLVDYMKRLVAEGHKPNEAALLAGRGRIRPILMTSMTTILGMLPVASGMGEGGKVLQPLGLAVIGGLWFSTLSTLFVVPLLQASYLNFKNNWQPSLKKEKSKLRYQETILLLALLLCFRSEKAFAAIDFYSTLDKLVQENQSVREERSRLQQVEAERLSHIFFWTPTIDLQYKVPTLNDSVSNPEQFNANANFNLFGFGADFARLQASRYRYRYEKFELGSREFNAEFDGLQLIFSRMSLHHQLEITRELLKSQEDLLAVARARFEKGFIPKQEVDKAEIDVENIRARINLLSVQEQEKVRDLLNKTDSDITDFNWPWIAGLKKELPAFKPLQNQTETARMEALQNLARSEEHLVREARLRLLPSVDLTLSKPLRDAGDGYNTRGYISVTLPIWDQFSRRRQISIHQAELEYVRWRKSDLEKSERAEAETSYTQLKLSQQTAQARQRNFDRAKSLYNDALARFKLGRMTANDLFLEQNRLLETQRLLVDGLYDYHVTLGRICRLESQSIRDQSCRWIH